MAMATIRPRLSALLSLCFTAFLGVCLLCGLNGKSMVFGDAVLVRISIAMTMALL